MTLTQRTALLWLLGFELIGAGLGWLILVMRSTDPTAQLGLLSGMPLVAVLFWGAWRGWRGIGVANLMLITLITSLLLINPQNDQQYAPIIFAPVAVAVVSTSARWTLSAAIIAQLLVLLRVSSASIYLRTDYLISYVFIAACLWIGRLILEQTQRGLNQALHTAQTEQQQARQITIALEQQAVTLQQQATEQEQLLATVSALEAPVIEVAEQILLVPIIGYVNEERGERLTNYVLQAITDQRARALILDITGMTQFDGYLARQLLHLASAVRLLGSQVVLSGISPEIATTLVQQRIQLGVRTAPTPFAALAALNESSQAQI